MRLRLLLAAAALLSLSVTVLAQAPHAHDHGGRPGDPHFCAVQADPNPQTLEQPDGRSFEAVHVGRGPVSYLETADGYTVQRDPADGFFKFVVAGGDGHLMLTDVVADEVADLRRRDARVVSSIAPHARVSGAVLAKAQRAKRARQEAGAHVTGKDGEKVDRIYGAFPSTGVRRALMLLVDFPDQLHVYDTTDIDRLCNEVGYGRNRQTGSFRDFYLDVSYDSLEVNTDVAPWYTSQEERAEYGIQDVADREFGRVPGLVREAVDDAEARGVDFSEYDNDGNGTVDVVFVIHSGRGAEESANTADIWSHRWSMAARDEAVRYDGVWVNDYIIQPEIYRGGGQITNIGVLAHEFGHALGLPDLYDTDGGSAGVGRWCLMAGGTWNDNGRTPAQPSVWCKAVMGWITPTEIALGSADTITDMAPTNEAPVAYQLLTDDPAEYFLVETRGDGKWDSRIPGSGVMIYHVDEDQFTNRDPDNYFVDVEQADGRRDLNRDANSGDGGDAFPGNNNRREFSCEPAGGLSSALYGGGDSDVKVTGIGYRGGRGSFVYGACVTACTYTRVEAADVDPDCDGGTYAQTVRVYAGAELGEGAVTVTLGDRLGRLYTGRAAAAAAPYTDVVVEGIPFGLGALSVVAEQADGTCRLLADEPIGRVIACPLANDEVCGAIDLTGVIGAAPVYATTAGHGVEDGEPTPKLNEPTGELGWGDGAASATAWFTFEAPASGHLVLESEGAIRVAVYEADDCAALLTPGAYFGVASNDNARPQDASAALADMRCLLPGRRYYLQVDADAPEDAGAFVLRLSAGRAGCFYASDVAECAPGAPATSVGSGTWLHLANEDGRTFASVNDLRNPLGDVTSTYAKRRGGARLLPDNQPLANRDWRFSVDADAEAVLRLYLTSADWREAQRLLGVSELSELVLRRSGYDACGAFGGGGEEFAPELTLARFKASDNLLQYRIPGSGNYVLKAASPLRTSFVSFAASAKTAGNELTWSTADEFALEGFTVQSRPGATADWADIATVAATAADGGGAEYAYVDVTDDQVTDYRLRRDDEDGLIGYSDAVTVDRSGLVSVRDAALERSLRVSPNPASGTTVVSVTGAASIELIDVRGAVLTRVPLSGVAVRHELSVAELSAGTYVLRAVSADGVATRRLVIK